MTPELGRSEVPTCGQYDSDKDGKISRDEVIDAITNYLFNKDITRDEATGVIRCYLFPMKVSEASYSFSIAENASGKPVVGRVTATGTQGGVTYSITEGNDSGRFATTTGGGIKVVSPLDHESRPTHALTVRVGDATGMWDEATVDITVPDVDESPEFDLDSYQFAIPISSRSMSTDLVAVGAVRAEDPDMDDLVSYSITSGNVLHSGCPSSRMFTIDGLGVIHVCPSGLPTSARDYSLTIRASDDSGNRDTSSVRIKYTNLTMVTFDVTHDRYSKGHSLDTSFRKSGASAVDLTLAITTDGATGGGVSGASSRSASTRSSFVIDGVELTQRTTGTSRYPHRPGSPA